jgi:hypothetical protein
MFDVDKAFVAWASDAEKYPLVDRITARLHLEGVTADQFHERWLRRYHEGGNRLSLATVNNIYSRMRDVSHGTFRLDKRLTELALELPI